MMPTSSSLASEGGERERERGHQHKRPRQTRFDLECTISHAKTVSRVLSGIQLSKRGGQKVKVWMSRRGVGFIAFDASKSLKAQATFRKETFETFRIGFGDGCSAEETLVEEEEDAEGEADARTTTTTATGRYENADAANDRRRRRNNLRGSHENGEEMKKYIGMSLDAFVDVLEMFANRSASSVGDESTGQTVSLSYPDRHGRVALESNSVRETMVVGAGVGRGNNNQRGLRPLRQTTYADVATEANVFGEDEDEMNNEDEDDRDEFLRIGRALVTFVLPTTRWKEIIEDLEWANANVSLVATRDSLAFVSESSDIGSVKVDVDLSSLVEYSFREAPSQGGETGRGENGGASDKRKQKWTYKQEFLKRTTMVPTHSGAVTTTAGGTNNAFGHYRQTQTQTQTQGGGSRGGGAGGFHVPHQRHHHVETDEAYQATTKISVGETGVLKVAHMLRLRALLGHNQSNAFGNTHQTQRNLHHNGGASTCNVPVTFIMASVVGDDYDDGMGSDDDDEQEYAEEGDE